MQNVMSHKQLKALDDSSLDALIAYYRQAISDIDEIQSDRRRSAENRSNLKANFRASINAGKRAAELIRDGMQTLDAIGQSAAEFGVCEDAAREALKLARRRS